VGGSNLILDDFSVTALWQKQFRKINAVTIISFFAKSNPKGAIFCFEKFFTFAPRLNPLKTRVFPTV
jgi:hypothetical protein